MLTIALITFICILSYISYNLFKKIEILEKLVDSQEQYITNVSNTIEYTNGRLEEIDEKGTFKSDDEIGWFFESIQTLQKELNDFNLNGRK